MQCRSCKAAIIWIKTATGANMPCDPTPRYYRPDKYGNAMIVTPGGHVVKASLAEEKDARGEGYISHFATCPEAGKHRKRAAVVGEQMELEM